jgi:lysozyme
MTALWKSIQSHLGIPADGIPGPATAQAVAKALGLHSAAAETRSISVAGLALIKQFEGLELKAYICPAGKLTIGYGSTGAHVKPGMVITEAQAEELLLEDLERFERAVRTLCPVTTQGQYDALCSFSFNLGEESLKTSTLRRKHNDGDYAGAAAEFAKWNKARVNGVLKELPGLTKRRAAEAKMYRGTA